ncbi:pheromone A receptor-domain-containing protein [Crucibulum laeve]|uniref:Pheromone A receptor-domain-containing protein n=1 Tax=Crucibulum laeve TaxID=68775 RepID=A0A5C3LIM1_9AGAR|nr:pheromone A receptor-domain-containing protein [Crucibulum laeve]
MPAALPALSFVFAFLLAVFIPVKRISGNVANLAIVSWLVGCNLVHGINAIVWTGNVNMSIPVWCDIVTKLLLGANMALPGACLCISRHLELISSTRTFSSEPRAVRNRMFIDLFLCYILPIIYMFLHVISQDRRFDLVTDYGCSASIHHSTPALMLMWGPPLLLCIITFLFSGRAVHNSFRQAHARFSEHLLTRSKMTSSLFLRRLVTVFSLTTVMALIMLFSIFSTPVTETWSSWDVVHTNMANIRIVWSPDDMLSIHLVWWGFFVLSVLHILISFTIGEESRDAFKWIRGKIVDHSRKSAQRQLLLPTISTVQASEMPSRSISLSKPISRPQTIELKSGWDDMLDVKTSGKRGTPSKKFKTSAPPSTCPSPAPSLESSSADDVFMASTLAYLGSPIAQSMGLSTPILPSPSPALVNKSFKKGLYEPIPSTPVNSTPHSSPVKTMHDGPSTPTISVRSVKTHPPRAVPVDAISVISSVFDASWPIPPLSPTPSIHRPHLSRSRSHSPKSSADEVVGYSVSGTTTPTYLCSRPFEGSSISSIGEIQPLPVKNTMPKRPSLRGLSRSWSKERMEQTQSLSNEVIHMMVVKEVV